jgi:predicted amidophosphoribosyltransferase
LKTLSRFIQLYCDRHHSEDERASTPAALPAIENITGHAARLCPHCAKLLAHAIVKRSHCRMSPKPACKHCPSQCYAPTYRRAIQEVMKFSGPRLVLTGRLDLLIHLLF